MSSSLEQLAIRYGIQSDAVALFNKHIKLVEAVNNSKTEKQRNDNCNILFGFREALEVLNINQLIYCDLHYLHQGIDRPMCGGVFLD
jgi:hypothetical protein